MLFLDAVGTAKGEIVRIAGTIMDLIRFVVPIILVIFGSFDLGKAVVAGKDDEIKKAQGLLVKRVIAAALVFLLGTLINLVLGLVAPTSDEDLDEGLNKITQTINVEEIA